MASILKFMPTRIEIEEEIRRKDILAEEHRRAKFVAARKIQARFRGIVTRRHLRKLHESARTIQRFWRGYRARIFADEYTVRLVHEMWENYYNDMATRIQSVWRGYWTRKTVVNFVQRRRWLKSVHDTNQRTKEDMKLFRLKEVGYVRSVLEQESMLWILYILFKVSVLPLYACQIFVVYKIRLQQPVIDSQYMYNISANSLHHLLRTKQRPGVITRIDKRCFTYIEQMLKCLEYELYRPREEQLCSICNVDARPSLFMRGTYFERCEEEIRRYEMNLKDGDASLLKHEPREDKRILASIDDLGMELLEENRLLEKKWSGEAFSYGSVGQTEFNEREYWDPMATWDDVCSSGMTPRSIRSIELYDAIEKMDCRLDRLRVKCPIHNTYHVNSL